MRDLVANLGIKGLKLLSELVAKRCSTAQAAWESAWREPALGLRFLYLIVGLFVAAHLIPYAFRELGVMGGISYLVALFGAVSNALFFRVVRVGRAEYVPLGLVAPIAIFIGLAGSTAIRPLLGDAKDAVLAEDFVGALVILAFYGFLALWFRRWQGGNPYS